ncbi:MAG TPA: hypothetical protein VIK72_19360 [Clostridiaceae bacterium]
MGYTKGIRWNDNLIESEIMRVAELLSINRMPSRTEIISITNDDALTNKIAKTGGFSYWAEKLKMGLKISDTSLGQDYELKAIELIEGKGFEVERMTTKYPFDLLINDNIKIDVKVSRPGYVKGSRVHTFRTTKKFATCDLYMIFALDENKAIEKFFIIPGSDLKVVTMCIGRKSKYDIFIDRWDLIEKYDKFYRELG